MSALFRMQNLLVVTITGLTLAGPALGLENIVVPHDNSEKADTKCTKNKIAVTGTVEHVELEGGFWGITGDDGKRYDVVNLPKEFRKQGLGVKFVGRIRSGQVSIHMWGVMVEVISIERIGDTMDR
jgi:hypothetical protein